MLGSLPGITRHTPMATQGIHLTGKTEDKSRSYEFMKNHGAGDAAAGRMSINLGHARLVTGGACFIGSHVVEALASAGHEVRVLDRAAAVRHPAGLPAFYG